MTHATFVPTRLRRGSSPARVAIVLGAALLLAPTALFAEVEVSGTAQAARVETRGGSIEEVLAALGQAFGLRWQSPAPLDKRLTGTYEGSLNRVLARLLDGYNFVLKAADGRVEIIVLGARGAAGATQTAAKPSAPAAAKPKSPNLPPPVVPPTLAAARSKVAQAPAAPAADPPAAAPAPTRVAEGPLPIPLPGQGEAVKPPEPQDTGVAPPVPGLGTGAVPVPQPSAVLPPGAGGAPPVPSSGGPAAPPKG